MMLLLYRIFATTLIIMLLALPAIAGETITIGILAFRPKPETLQRTQPLSRALEKGFPGYEIRIEPLSYDELRDHLNNNRLDFALINPGIYVQLRKSNSMTGVLATMVDNHAGYPVSKLGGVIIARADRADIVNLADLKGKKIAVVERGSLGGYQSQAYELSRIGVNLSRDAQLTFTGLPHDNVLAAVMSGRADAGFLRTGTLEEMAAEGKLDLKQIKVINRQNMSAYPCLVSTRLYPGWPFVAMPHVKEKLASRIASILLGMEPSSNSSGQVAFTIPADYGRVEEMLRELRLPPFDIVPKIEFHDVWKLYRWQVVLFSTACGIIFALMFVVVARNRQLAASQQHLEKINVTLLESESRFRSLFDLSPIPLAKSSHDGRVMYLNRQFVKSFGYTLEDIPTVTDWLIKAYPNEAYREMVLSTWSAAVALAEEQKREINPIEYITTCKDGSVHILEISGFPLDDGLLVTFIDNTQRKQYQTGIIEARDAAEAANRAKSEFLANMSHEIRTPMNGIMGMAQLLTYTELNDEQKEYLGYIEASGRNLLSLINDILDLSRIESGKMVLEYLEFSLGQVIKDVINTQIYAIRNKLVDIKYDATPDVPETVHGDQLRFKQIILNLIGNAIKFTEQGTISVSAKVESRVDDTVIVTISVTDTGIGIASDQLEHIFGAFNQADSSITRCYGGTGLGLTICCRLVELMGGSIRVKSELGNGSTFIVSLPFETASHAEAITTSTDLQHFWKGPPLSILVAEDNPVNQKFINVLLLKMGHFVKCCSDGRQALENWRTGHFDCILMDIQMPVMGGEDSLHLIREEEAAGGNHIPVIALTAHALVGDRERFLENGFDGYLAKPFQINELVELLSEIVAPISSRKEMT